MVDGSRNMESYVVRLKIKKGVIVQDADFRCVRPTYRGGWELPMSPYANPFFAKKNATGNEITDSMLAVRDFYRYWYHPEQAALREQARRELPGKTLGCFCKDYEKDPRNEIFPCHCDVITYDVNGILTPILSQIMKTYNLTPENTTMIPTNYPRTPLPGQIPARPPVITPQIVNVPIMPTGNAPIPQVYPTTTDIPTTHPVTTELDIEDDTVPEDTTDKPDPDRIMAMIAGHAIGDALGVPHEFRYQHDVYTGVLQYRAKLVQQFQGVKYLGVGQYSDDTEMGLVMARQMIKDHADKRNTGGAYNRDHVLDAYLEWGQSKQPMMGNNTRQLLKGGV